MNKQSNNKQRVKKYYVYGHYTNNNRLFYIGVGTILNFKSQKETQRYSRAYHFSNRTNIWNNTRNKYGVKVKILHKYYTKEESLRKEKELIEKFGRKIMNEGFLTNISTGGEIGPIGRKFKMSDEQKKKLSDIKSKTLYVYTKTGVFLSSVKTIKKTAEYIGVTYNAIHSCLQTNNYSNECFIFEEYRGKKLDLSLYQINFKSTLSKKVITEDSTGCKIRHLSIADAANYLETDRKNLKLAIKNKRLCKKHNVYFERAISSQDSKD